MWFHKMWFLQKCWNKSWARPAGVFPNILLAGVRLIKIVANNKIKEGSDVGYRATNSIALKLKCYIKPVVMSPKLIRVELKYRFDVVVWRQGRYWEISRTLRPISNRPNKLQHFDNAWVYEMEWYHVLLCMLFNIIQLFSCSWITDHYHTFIVAELGIIHLL